MNNIAEMPIADVKEELALVAELERRAERYRCRTDLYYLLTEIFGRKDIEHEWLKARVEEVQADPDGYLDLWARDHRKSTIITYALSIQDILSSHGRDPLPKWNGKEITIGIFSHTRPIAKAFLRQIKRELEENQRLKELFPDILYENPQKQAPTWSEDNGIVVKRKSNAKESTVEAWGLVDGQPTSKHFDILVFDDVVTRASVSSPEMIAKTSEAFQLANNLGTSGGIERCIGSKYHMHDTYTMLEKRGIKMRYYPATKDGKWPGVAVFKSQKELEESYKKQGPYVFAAQMLLNPTADMSQGFKEPWLKHYKQADGWENMNRYILCDPAGEKKKGNDYTVFAVIGLAPDKNYYLLDLTRDRLNLTERTEELFRLHKRWMPNAVGYEKYGKDSDIEHINEVMEHKNYRFTIEQLGGAMPKNDRIRRLVPLFEQGRFYIPYKIEKVNYEHIKQELIQIFIRDEFLSFPVSAHDDMLDCFARITDEKLHVEWPIYEERYYEEEDMRVGMNSRTGY